MTPYSRGGSSVAFAVQSMIPAIRAVRSGCPLVMYGCWVMEECCAPAGCQTRIGSSSGFCSWAVSDEPAPTMHPDNCLMLDVTAQSGAALLAHSSCSCLGDHASLMLSTMSEAKRLTALANNLAGHSTAHLMPVQPRLTYDRCGAVAVTVCLLWL